VTLGDGELRLADGDGLKGRGDLGVTAGFAPEHAGKPRTARAATIETVPHLRPMA
jgi:hypothetical protein